MTSQQEDTRLQFDYSSYKTLFAKLTGDNSDTPTPAPFDSSTVDKQQVTGEEHKIEADPSLLKKVIVDQTDTIEKGWREAVQNAIDAGADLFTLDFSPTETFMSDDGDGVPLDEEAGLRLLTAMGNSSKEGGNDDNIGRFGVGTGQIIAKGQTVFISGGTALLFDVKNWGLTVQSVPLAQLHRFLQQEDQEWADTVSKQLDQTSELGSGMTIIVDHYPDEVPDEDNYKWDKFERTFRTRFQYLGAVRDTDICINGETVSGADPMSITSFGSPTYTEQQYDFATGKVIYGVKPGNGSLTVYSGGIKVTNVDSRGLQGHIITDKNLDLGLARNEIKSGCAVWSAICESLDDIRETLFVESDDGRNLCDSAREFLATELLDNGTPEPAAEMELFKTVNETYVSLADIQSRDEIATAQMGNKAAEQLVEAYGMIVLSESDPASSVVIEHGDEDADKIPPLFDPEARATAHNLFTAHEVMHDDDLTGMQRKKLGVARYMAERMGCSRSILWGESDVAHGWTDGENSITLTDSCASGTQWVEWVPRMWETLVHEAAHSLPDKEQSDHGIGFNSDYRDLLEGDGLDALRQTQADIQSRGLNEVADIGNT